MQRRTGLEGDVLKLGIFLAEQGKVLMGDVTAVLELQRNERARGEVLGYGSELIVVGPDQRNLSELRQSANVGQRSIGREGPSGDADQGIGVLENALIEPRIGELVAKGREDDLLQARMELQRRNDLVFLPVAGEAEPAQVMFQVDLFHATEVRKQTLHHAIGELAEACRISVM